MNGGQIALYASVATVIPVVLSIYVVGLRAATPKIWWAVLGFFAKRLFVPT